MAHSAEPETLPVGSDQVLIYDDRLVIMAAHEMDWPTREFARPPIFFKDCKFYLRRKEKAAPPFAMRYELWVWPEDNHDAAPRSIFYDEAYVAERDSHFHSDKINARTRFGLLLVYPLLGFFWSGFKEQTLIRFGFDARSITKASVMLAFHFCLLEGVFVGWLRSGLLAVILNTPELILLDFILLVALALDSLVRCHQLLGGEADYPDGFMEWLFPRRSPRLPPHSGNF